MKLDSRILEGKKPLDCFDEDIAKQFIGKKGFVTNFLQDFCNLSKVKVSKLKTVLHTELFCYLCGSTGKKYFLPVEWVKEPENKYRPYAVMEFIKYYPIGSHLHFRPKNNTMEMHRLIDGYNDCKNGAGTLFICGMMYSMRELYNNYEIFKDGEWQPFGVLDDGDKDKE